MIDPSQWLVIQGELVIRATPEGATAELLDAVLLPINHRIGTLDLGGSMSPLIERSIPVEHGTNEICRRPSVLLIDPHTADPVQYHRIVGTDSIAAAEICYQYHGSSHSYFLPRYGIGWASVRLAAESPRSVDQLLSCSDRHVALSGTILASPQTCSLHLHTAPNTEVPVIGFDPDQWYPLIKRHVPADNQPKWPSFEFMACVSGRVVRSGAELLHHAWFANVANITIIKSRSLHRIASQLSPYVWIYQDIRRNLDNSV